MVNTKIRLIIVFAAKDGEALYSQQKKRLGADCGSDHELLIAKFRLKLKKVGKTTWPFRYDLNQIPYDYTVEVTSRFKGLDLIECLRNNGQRFMALSKLSFNSLWTENFQLFKLNLEKAEESKIKLPTSAGSLEKQEFQKNIYFCFTDYTKAVWIITKSRKFLKRWEY